MPEEKIKEFKQNGFYVLSNLQFILAVIIVIMTLAVNIGISMERFMRLEAKAGLNASNITSLQSVRQRDSNLQREIKFNLKILMEKFNLKYIEDTNK